jgi:TonB-dependent starch-binding outer membrane protein SusC
MRKKMYQIQKFACSIIFVIGFYPSCFSQDVIASIQEPSRNSRAMVVNEALSKITLKEGLKILMEHYKVDIVYADKIIQSLSITNRDIDFSKSIEKNLSRLLREKNLLFRKLKDGTYTIKTKSALLDKEEKESVPTKSREETLQISTPILSSGELSLSKQGVSLSNSSVKSDVNVSGKVIDESTGEPLSGVNILVEDTKKGTATNSKGEFSISVPNSNSVLIFTLVGYTTYKIKVGTRTSINVSLRTDVVSLNEVVVIGYGSKNKKDLTGSISTVSSKDIAKSISPTAELALQGRAPGVFVSTPGGSAFARPQVRIRGVSTFGFAEPLYVIDGVPITEYGAGTDSDEQSSVADFRGSVNILSTINPNDIESMSVLKDASAAAIYGVRAANGVILITTKKGSKGTPRVDISMSHSIQNVVNKLSMLNTQDFTKLYQEAYANNPNSAKDLPAQFNPSSPLYLGNSQTYDWQTPLLNRNAPNSDISLRVSGGNDATRYYVSGGYTASEGALIQNNMKRYSLATNIDTKISKYLSAGLTFRGSYTDALDNTGFQNDLRSNADTSPWQPIFDPTNPTKYAPVVRTKFKANPELGAVIPNFSRPQFLGSIPPTIFDGDPVLLYGPETNTNTFALMDYRRVDFGIVRTLGTGFLQVEPIEGLKIKGTLSVDWTYNRRNQWESENSLLGHVFQFNPQNPYAIGDGTSEGLYREYHTRNFNLVKELSVSYGRSFGQHTFDILLNAMDQKYTFEALNGSAQQILSADPNFRNLGSPTPYSAVSSFRDINALQGYLARLSYNYDNKYYFDGTVRRDGASRFAPGFKNGTFPAFSVAWRISKEDFMKDIDFINDLKIRGGWGRLGNQETRSFAYLSLISNTPDYALGSGSGNAVGSLQNGIRLPDFPVRDLSWEVGETSSFGVDGAFFNNKLNVTLEYYNRLTSGILQQGALPASVGNEAQPIFNIASVRNRGVELQVGYNGTVGKGFNYNVSGNITTVDNKVISTFQDQPFGGGTNRIEVGQPIGYLWGYKVSGVLANQAAVDAYKASNKDAINNGNAQAGDLAFVDINGKPAASGQGPSAGPDGTIDANDQTFLGSTIPSFYYGINLGANYKNFDISVFFQGVGDVYRYNNTRARGESMSGPGANQWTTTLNRWTPTNQNTNIPRAVFGDPAQNSRFSDRFVENASFLRLKNIQLGYSLPASVTKSLGFVNGLRLYVAATNLFVITNWSGPDPEDSDRLGQLIPPTRALTVGLTASF